MLAVGATIREAVAAGLTPLLAVQVNGPAPVDDKFALAPKHIIVLEGVIVIESVGDIETVAIAVVVHAPVPDKTVKVVVADGVTVTLAKLAGLPPVLAVQENGPVPVEVNETLSPKQITVFDGVILMAGVAPIDTVATAEAVQLPVPDRTV